MRSIYRPGVKRDLLSKSCTGDLVGSRRIPADMCPGVSRCVLMTYIPRDDGCLSCDWTEEQMPQRRCCNGVFRIIKLAVI